MSEQRVAHSKILMNQLMGVPLACTSREASWPTRAFLEIGILVQDEH